MIYTGLSLEKIEWEAFLTPGMSSSTMFTHTLNYRSTLTDQVARSGW